MSEFAKIEQKDPNCQQDDFVSAKKLTLRWTYQAVHGTLLGMYKGVRWPDEVVRIVSESNGEHAGLFDEQRRLAEPETFDRMMRATAPRTVRRLVKQSQWLRGSRLGVLLWEQPERFLEIKAHPRFPKTSAEKQIDFLARTTSALIAGYQPNTSLKYLATMQRCEHCGERFAVIELIRDNRVYQWCGEC